MRGLILIQIDGLARPVLRQAMKENRMPFISEMSKSKDRRLWTFYSGIPSNTPSVQGEIFYGIRQCVPAFQFRDRRTRKKMTMYECGNAQEIEERLQKQGAALLSEGSSYGNIFTGGAKRFAFCITALQFSADFFKFSVMRFARFLVLNPFFCAKTILQMAGEVLIGVKDVLSGVLRGEHVTQELSFVFTRVIGSIFLRNWITVSTVIDMREKLPVIHLNYFGYDEQAHRRGPTSEFALWSLKGIDDAVKTVCRAAEKMKRRYPYDVWIYSDHGQEESRPYSSVIGNDIKCIIENYFRATEYKHGRYRGRQDVSLNEWQKLYAERLAKSGKSGSIPPVNEEGQWMICSMGSMAHVYSDTLLKTFVQREELAKHLTMESQVPVVLTSGRDREILFWTSEGRFHGCDALRDLLNADEAYAEEMLRDIRDLVFHPDSGHLILMGWSRSGRVVTFPSENGSHSGPGANETHGFALLPASSALQELKKGYLRPSDLREAVFRYRQESPEPVQ